MTDPGPPTDTPSRQGVDAAGVLRFLDALEAADGVQPHSLMLVRHGRVVAQGWWSPYDAEMPHLLYSLSKSVTSTALGFAVAEGLVGLDDPVLRHVPELEAEVRDDRVRRLLVRHVASMASGHTTDTWGAAWAADPGDPLRGFLLTPPEQEPGSVFCYNQPCTYAVAALVTRAAGAPLTDYLRPRLFDPLGIGDVWWLRDRSGRELGFSGLHATTDAIARLGVLYLQGGVWRGRQVLPAGWAELASAHHVATPREPAPDWRQGYGFQFWRARHGYRGDGAYGQFCVVLPEHDAVLAMTGESEDMQAVLDAAWQHLLPALGDGPRTGAAAAADDDRLAARLDALRVPVVTDVAGSPPAGARWDGLVARAAAGEPLTSLEVRADGAGWRVTLVDDRRGVRIDVPLGTSDWAVAASGAVPVAASGGWQDGDTLRVDVAFLETPHRLGITCRAGGTVTSAYRTAPLHSRGIGDLHAPRADLSPGR